LGPGGCYIRVHWSRKHHAAKDGNVESGEVLSARKLMDGHHVKDFIGYVCFRLYQKTYSTIGHNSGANGKLRAQPVHCPRGRQQSRLSACVDDMLSCASLFDAADPGNFFRRLTVLVDLATVIDGIIRNYRTGLLCHGQPQR
jgi:hypothetical protein